MLDGDSYVGWIPCVNGHLDFALIRPGIRGGLTKESKKDRKSTLITYAPKGHNDSHARNVVMQSWVDWQDERTEDGTFRVCAFATVKEQSDLDLRELNGSLIIYPKAYEIINGEHVASLLDKIHDMAAIQKPNWKERQKLLNESWDIIQNCIPSCNTKNPFGQVISETTEMKPNLFRVDFKVKANGLAYLSFHELENQISGNNTLTEEDKFVICRQAFYYIKYSLHVHKHHEHKVDALTSIVKNDQYAGMKMIGQIKRELTGIKRTQLEHKRRHHSAEAIGIIGYLQSFQTALHGMKMITDEQYEMEKERLKGLEKSFNAQVSRFEEKYIKNLHIATAGKQWATIFLATVSLCFIAFVNLYAKNISVNNPGDNIALLNNLASNPIHFLLFPLVLIICVSMFYFTIKLYYNLRNNHFSFWRAIFKMNVIWLILAMLLPPFFAVSIALYLNW